MCQLWVVSYQRPKQEENKPLRRLVVTNNHNVAWSGTMWRLHCLKGYLPANAQWMWNNWIPVFCRGGFDLNITFQTKAAVRWNEAQKGAFLFMRRSGEIMYSYAADGYKSSSSPPPSPAASHWKKPPVTQSCACWGLSKQSGRALLLSQIDSLDMREPQAVWRQPLQWEEKCWLMPGSTDAGRGYADHSERAEARTKSPLRASQLDVCDDYRWFLLHSGSLPLPPLILFISLFLSWIFPHFSHSVSSLLANAPSLSPPGPRTANIINIQ